MTGHPSARTMAQVNLGNDTSNALKDREWINKDIYMYLIVMMLSLIIVSPMLTTGYVSDDSLNSLFRGIVLESRGSLPHHIYSMAKNSIIYGARFIPLVSISSSVIFILISNLYLYKMSILFLTVTNILLFRYLIELITRSKALSFLSILFLPLSFQFRFFHDPILSFGGLEQIVFLYTLSSLIFLEFYLRTNRKYLLLASLFFFMLDLMTYESTYPFFMFHSLLIYFHSGDGKISFVFRKTTPFLLMVMVFILISVSLRFVFPQNDGYEGIKAKFSTLPFMITLLKQCYAATPLSYFVADPHSIFSKPFVDLRRYFGVPHFLITVGFLVLFFEFSRGNIRGSNPQSDPRGTKRAFLFGFLLFVIPSTLVALSSKYQKELSWGVGYIPVYISYFGLSIIMGVISFEMFGGLRRSRMSLYIFSMILAIVCGVIGSINYTNNETVTKYLNHAFLYPRAFIEQGMKNGLLKGVPQESFLVVDNDYDLDAIQGGWSFYRWDRRAFYFMNSGVRLNPVGVKEGFLKKNFISKLNTIDLGGQSFCIEVPREQNHFYLGYYAHNSEEGYAVLGKISSLFLKEDRPYRVTSKDSILVYVQIPFYYRPQKLSLVGHFIDGNSPEPFTIHGNHLQLINSGMNWKLFKIDPGKTIDLKSLRVVFTDEGA